LIVVVVIATLASITVIAYRDVQTRARDSMRADGVAKIKRALELYKIDNGRYPTATGSGCDSWERSSCESGPFMEYLADYGLSDGTPLDPINKMGPPNYVYFYYRYAPGNGGCDISKGGFYVLRATFEKAANKPPGNTMAEEGCSSPSSAWSDSAGTGYTFHAFENE
jgi:type II secretory pathway pseudopilin PulG